MESQEPGGGLSVVSARFERLPNGLRFRGPFPES